MVILQTLLGLLIVYIIICAYLAYKEDVNMLLGNWFLKFSLVVGYIVIAIFVVLGVLFISYIIGCIAMFVTLNK